MTIKTTVPVNVILELLPLRGETLFWATPTKQHSRTF